MSGATPTTKRVLLPHENRNKRKMSVEQLEVARQGAAERKALRRILFAARRESEAASNSSGPASGDGTRSPASPARPRRPITGAAARRREKNRSHKKKPKHELEVNV